MQRRRPICLNFSCRQSEQRRSFARMWGNDSMLRHGRLPGENIECIGIPDRRTTIGHEHIVKLLSPGRLAQAGPESDDIDPLQQGFKCSSAVHTMCHQLGPGRGNSRRMGSICRDTDVTGTRTQRSHAAQLRRTRHATTATDNQNMPKIALVRCTRPGRKIVAHEVIVNAPQFRDNARATVIRNIQSRERYLTTMIRRFTEKKPGLQRNKRGRQIGLYRATQDGA